MRDLVGQNIVVLDLETARSADDCRHCGQTEAVHASGALPSLGTAPYPSGYTCRAFAPIGWDRKRDLGLSIGCYYDYQDSLFHWFDVATLEATVQLFVEREPLLVSFNGIAFDFALMRALLRYEVELQRYGLHAGLGELCDVFKLLCASSYDLLAEIWKVDSASKFVRGLNSLDAISQANGYGTKAMNGAQAPRLWAQGRVAEVLNYCQGDVLKTRQLFEQILSIGLILRGDGLPIYLPRPRQLAGGAL